jgi:large subunit ribosomal protein L24
MQAGSIDKEMPIPVSNLAILCAKGGRTPIGYTVAEDGLKTRVCRKCGTELPRTKREQTK